MKRLSFMLTCLLVALSAGAAELKTPFKGVEAKSIDGVYLYNVATGLWLQNNRKDSEFWTTRGQLDTKGFDVELVAVDGAFRINPKLANNQSMNDFNLYCDTSQPVTQWTFTRVESDEDTYIYTITSGTYALGARDKNGENLITNLSELFVEDGGYWQIVTEEERLSLLDNATEDNPVDVSFLIKDADFGAKDERYSYWEGVTGDWGVGGDNIVNCNMVLENWNLTEADIHQTVTLPNGVYEVSANASYNPTGASGISLDNYNAYINGNSPVAGVIYANEKTVPMQNFYSIARDTKINYCQKQIGNVWVPMGVGQVSAAFYNGLYRTDSLRVRVTDNKLQVGAKVIEGTGTSWIVVDNFTLRYLGTEATVPGDEDLPVDMAFTAAPGTEEEVAPSQLNTITLTFSEASLVEVTDGMKVEIIKSGATDEDGNAVVVGSSASLTAENNVLTATFDANIEESGEYSITFPEGLLKADGHNLKAITLVYNVAVPPLPTVELVYADAVTEGRVGITLPEGMTLLSCDTGRTMLVTDADGQTEGTAMTGTDGTSCWLDIYIIGGTLAVGQHTIAVPEGLIVLSDATQKYQNVAHTVSLTVVADGINGVTAVMPYAGKAVYNIAGQRLEAPKKGINIVNGHKVIVR